MNTRVNVPNPSSSRVAPGGGASPHPSQRLAGTRVAWRGATLTVAAAAASRISPTRAGTVSPTWVARRKPLALRKVSTEQAFKPMPMAQIPLHSDGVFSHPTELRRMARAILTGRAGGAPEGRRRLTAQYLALQYAAGCLDEDDDDLVALITPVGGEPGSAQQFSQMMQQPGEDAEELLALLRDVIDSQEGQGLLSGDAFELYHQLKGVRHDASQLARLLAQAQGLPPVAVLRANLRQKIADQIRDLENSADGTLILSSLNARDAAAASADPAGFLDTYSALVDQHENFCGALKLLLTRCPLEQLASTIDGMKKALADDMAAAAPSQDRRRLGTILTDLSHMHLSTTLAEMVDELAGQQARLGGAVSTPDPSRVLLIGLVDILANGSALALQFERLAREFGAEAGAQTIALLSGMKKILRELPDKAFADRNARIAMLDAAQDALDAAIEAEEDAADAAGAGDTP